MSLRALFQVLFRNRGANVASHPGRNPNVIAPVCPVPNDREETSHRYDGAGHNWIAAALLKPNAKPSGTARVIPSSGSTRTAGSITRRACAIMGTRRPVRTSVAVKQTVRGIAIRRMGSSDGLHTGSSANPDFAKTNRKAISRLRAGRNMPYLTLCRIRHIIGHGLER